MQIILTKSTTFPGVYNATFGKRKIVISLSVMDAQLGIVPSDAEVRAAFNNCSRPKDQMIHSLIPVVHKQAALPPIREIEIATMNAWLQSGAIQETQRGQENVYFVDQFNNQFFCKCL